MSGKRPSSKAGPGAYDYLIENGPTSRDELPHTITIECREAGVCSFKFRKGHNGSGSRVYFIDGEHSEENVIETWASENETIVEKLNDTELHSSCPKRFRAALKDVCDLHLSYGDSDRPVGYTQGGTCPLCGESHSQSLARHLPCEDGGAE